MAVLHSLNCSWRRTYNLTAVYANAVPLTIKTNPMYSIIDQRIFWQSNGLAFTVRLLTHVLCKPTHFFFHSFIATMSSSLQTSFNSVMNNWIHKFYVRGTPTMSPSRSNNPQAMRRPPQFKISSFGEDFLSCNILAKNWIPTEGRINGRSILHWNFITRVF